MSSASSSALVEDGLNPEPESETSCRSWRSRFASCVSRNFNYDADQEKEEKLSDLQFFLRKGTSLGISAFLNWGLPPLIAMVLAGHVKDSVRIQASFGYGRLWYNCTNMMPTVACFQYVNSSIPGCIGADRRDRIPRYLQRGILVSIMVLLPFYTLQFFAEPILVFFNVPTVNAKDVGMYCKMMILTSFLTVIDGNLEGVIVNLGYAKCSTFNSMLCGVGIDIIGAYFYIYRWNWGVVGIALNSMTVKACRITVWICLCSWFKILRKITIAPEGCEKLLTIREVRIFVFMILPQLASYLAGWLIFELQAIAVTNVKNIPDYARTASCIWIQFETAFAAAQTGWISATSMRVIRLLGKRDPRTPKVFVQFSILSNIGVAFLNVLLIIFRDSLARIISNDEQVRDLMKQLLWVLVAHTQTRICLLLPGCLFNPMGKGMFWIGVLVISFYLLSSPISLTVALTDWFSHSMMVKLIFCLANVPLAQFFGGSIGFIYMYRMDWDRAAEIINRRANSDRARTLSTESLGVTS